MSNNEPQSQSDKQVGFPSSNVDVRDNKPQSELGIQLGYPSSNAKKPSDKYVTYLNWLPHGITELIFLQAFLFRISFFGTHTFDT